MQVITTKTWDMRALDVIENFNNRGIVYKIANSCEEDFTKCSLA